MVKDTKKMRKAKKFLKLGIWILWRTTKKFGGVKRSRSTEKKDTVIMCYKFELNMPKTVRAICIEKNGKENESLRNYKYLYQLFCSKLVNNSPFFKKDSI